MNSNTGVRVIHLVPPNGGGVDRCVRDLCDRRPDDWLLHVTDGQVVIEAPRHQLMAPVALDSLTALVEGGALGRAAALHAHSTVPAVRRATGILAKAMGLRYVVTLHDVEFAGGPGTDDPAERDRRIEFIRSAASCTVPSGYMRDRVLEVFGKSFACTVVENGVDRLASTPAQARAQRFPVAVIGAMGRHKGLDQLVEVAAQLPADQGIVLLGYADGELGPGWLPGSRIWVHGAFEPAELPALVASYGSVLAFFPKGQPESYCYALSDAWQAGLPVVAPDWGAIGERVRAHGAGTLYDPGAPAAVVAQAISAGVRAVADGAAAVGQAARSLASVSTMVNSMNDIYSGIAVPEKAPDLDALRRSAANHLDSRFFRRELLRLRGDLTAAEQQRDNALRELEALAENFRQRGVWSDQLQQTGDSLKQECHRLQQEVLSLQQSVTMVGQELDRIRAAEQALRAEHAALQSAYRDLKTTVDRLVWPLKWALQLLPARARAWVVTKAKRILTKA